MITENQEKLIRFIEKFMSDNNYCPSYREMAKGIGGIAQSNAHRMVDCLEKRGFIRRIKGTSRALEIIRTPKYDQVSCPHCGAKKE